MTPEETDAFIRKIVTDYTDTLTDEQRREFFEWRDAARQGAKR